MVSREGAEALHNVRIEEATIHLPFVTVAFRVKPLGRIKFAASKNSCKKGSTKIFTLNNSEPAGLRKDTTLSQTILFVHQIAFLQKKRNNAVTKMTWFPQAAPKGTRQL